MKASNLKVEDNNSEFERMLCEKIKQATDEISKVVIGQPDVVKLLLAAAVSGGHAMIVGVPGLAKTLLVETTAKVLGFEMRRIQFTPDLMPADITGSEVMESSVDGSRHFRFIKGPIFTEMLMADEINRGNPRTQSALLQAMQEHKVTIAGVNHTLPSPFMVVATRNPIEQEGTYPIPEAQADRFMLELGITYPDEEYERRILVETTGGDDFSASGILSVSEIMQIQKIVRDMPVGEKFVATISRMIRETRPETTTIDAVKKYVAWGAGTRAGQALMLTSRALAFIEQKTAPSLDEVSRLMDAVFRHRVRLNYAAKADGVTLSDIMIRVLEKSYIA